MRLLNGCSCAVRCPTSADLVPPFLFRCPNTGYRVQAYAPDETDDPEQPVLVTCPVCSRLHHVVPERDASDSDSEE